MFVRAEYRVGCKRRPERCIEVRGHSAAGAVDGSERTCFSGLLIVNGEFLCGGRRACGDVWVQDFLNEGGGPFEIERAATVGVAPFRLYSEGIPYRSWYS